MFLRRIRERKNGASVQHTEDAFVFESNSRKSVGFLVEGNHLCANDIVNASDGFTGASLTVASIDDGSSVSLF